MSSYADAGSEAVLSSTARISRRGRWMEVPALQRDDETVVVDGGLIKIASLCDEDWIEHELQSPEIWVKAIKANRSTLKADILRFSQKVPDASQRFQYPMELRSIAVAEVGNFKMWWESLPQESRNSAI
jgi:hypothetical protein